MFEGDFSRGDLVGLEERNVRPKLRHVFPFPVAEGDEIVVVHGG